MKNIFALLFLFPVAAMAQGDSVLSGVYKWKEPAPDHRKISSAILIEGKVHDFEWLQLTANRVPASNKKTEWSVPSNEEQLVIIKSGNIQVELRDSSFSLSPNSVAILMPGEKFSWTTREPCTFYLMKYRSKSPVDTERFKKEGGSFVVLWENLPFIPNSNGGGRRDFFNRSTAMQKRIEMHVTTLKEGIKSHEPHTHRAEELVLMIEGNTEMQIGDQFYKGQTGDVFYLGSNVSHAIRNEGTKPCMYFAFQIE